MILAILSIIAVWMFQVPLAWAVTITVFASIEIIAAFCKASLTAHKVINDN